MSRESGISASTGSRIVRRDLGLKTRARERRHKLKQEDKINRMLKSEIILNHHLNRNRLMIFEDESKIEMGAYVNSRLDRVIERRAGDSGDISVNMRQRQEGLMIAGFWLSDGKKFLRIFEPGESVCGQRYILLLEEFFLWLVVSYTPDELHDCLFIQDNAPCHSSIEAQAFLQDSVRAIGGQFLTKHEWPSHSPDLNPLDYSGWNSLKRDVCDKDGLRSIGALRQKIRAKWYSLFPAAEVRRFCEKFQPRLERCVARHGNYVEKVI